MRVTFHTAYGGVEHVNTAASQVARARQQVESGKRIAVASDDPAGMQRAVEGRAEIAGLDIYARTANAAAAKLTTLDTTLGAIVDRLTQATVTATSVRGSEVTQAQRDAAALTLEGLRDALAGDLNTSYRGVYVFGGTQALTPPYAKVAGVWTYQGNNTPASVDVGPGQTVDVGLDGQALAQGSDATNLLNELESLITAARTGDGAGLATGIAALDRAFTRAVRMQSQIGVDEAGMADRQLQITTARLAATARVSKDEDADLVDAISEMNRAEIAYRAALGAVGTASRASLLDYLR